MAEAQIVDPPARRARWPKVIVAIAIVVVVLVVAFFVADAILRPYAESRVSQAISSNLPSSVSGDVDVQIGGGPVIAQYLSGSFSDVRLYAPSLKVNGAPVSVSVQATGVPTDLSKPVGNIKGALTVRQAALNSLIDVPGVTGDVTLGSGTLTYHDSAKIFGIPIGYEVTAKPKADGDSVTFVPTGVRLTSGSFGLDLSKQLQALVGAKPISVCVAQYLPAGVSVTGIDVTPGEATVTLDAPNLVLSEDSLATKGSCS